MKKINNELLELARKGIDEAVKNNKWELVEEYKKICEVVYEIENELNCKEETNLDIAVKAIVKDIKETIETHYSDWEIRNWHDMLEAFGQDSKAFKEDVWYILNKCKELDSYNWNDECEIYEKDGTIITYRQLTNAVRKELDF